MTDIAVSVKGTDAHGDFNFRSKKLCRHVLTSLKKFHTDSTYTDVTLVAGEPSGEPSGDDNAPIRCHKAVLAALSVYLHQTFMKQNKGREKRTRELFISYEHVHRVLYLFILV